MRLLRTSLVLDDVKDRMKDLVKALYRTIPTGAGRGGAIAKLSEAQERQLLVEGAPWAVAQGFGRASDLQFIEDGGRMPGAEPDVLSRNAVARGLDQVGTLGSGNHFLEIDVIEEVYLPEIAHSLGLVQGGIAIGIHTGSRGLGYQVCDDSIERHLRSLGRHHIELPDPQLACAPLKSAEGREYLAAMACAANFAWVNRQVIMTLAEQAIAKVIGRGRDSLGFRLIYDVCHNIAKTEEHVVDGAPRKVVVHRKGATRAFGPGHPLVPEAYRAIGQPVLVPGDMGRASYLLLGATGAMAETFGSSCHGAGRVASRSKMIKQTAGRDLFREMADRGVVVMSKSRASVAEEMPEAYKDVSEVVDTIENAGISRKLVKLRPLGVIKG